MKSNKRADYLSRGKIQEFKALGECDPYPTRIASEIWPVDKIWID